MAPVQAPLETNGRHVNWLEVFDTYCVRFVILNTRYDDLLLRLVQSHPQWIVDSVEGDTVFFTRIQAPESAPVLA